MADNDGDAWSTEGLWPEINACIMCRGLEEPRHRRNWIVGLHAFNDDEIVVAEPLVANLMATWSSAVKPHSPMLLANCSAVKAVTRTNTTADIKRVSSPSR